MGEKDKKAAEEGDKIVMEGKDKKAAEEGDEITIVVKKGKIVMKEGDEITIVVKKEKIVSDLEKKNAQSIHSSSIYLILLSSFYFLFNLFFLIFPLVIFNNANYAFEFSVKSIFIICSFVIFWIGVTLMFIVLVRHLIKIKLIRFESETSKQDILKKEAYKLTEYLITKAEEKRN